MEKTQPNWVQVGAQVGIQVQSEAVAGENKILYNFSTKIKFRLTINLTIFMAETMPKFKILS